MDNEEEYDATIVDLSGGGCRFKISQPIEIGTVVVLKLSLPDKPVLRLTCRIIRIFTRDDKADSTYYCGLEFVEIRESHRDIIIKYLFDIQRDNIKKRRI